MAYPTILARNKALQGEPQKSDWGRHIATIPNVVLVQWMNQEGADVQRLLECLNRLVDAGHSVLVRSAAAFLRKGFRARSVRTSIFVTLES